MAANEVYFVEWKEQYVSKERGNRVVHYLLKDNCGESILAVVGTERSVRHMFYVVSDEFLSILGAESSVHSGFRWRSRREVVNWLTSMLSKQYRRGDYAMTVSHRDNPSTEVNFQQTIFPSHKGRLVRNVKGNQLDISWSGVAWACGKQLKHYPAFCRNGISIPVQSFVFVMAEKENRYIAYLEDMYEDRKCQKKVKVRWFHHNKEVKGIGSVRNPHPKEVFITPYVQVISAECVDGPAIVLTREHYEKCLTVFPNDLLDRVHYCFRQYKNSCIKPFKLRKLRGYFDQPIFSCFSPDFFEDEEHGTEDDVKVGDKRSRSCREKITYNLLYHKKLKYGLLSRDPKLFKHVEGHVRHTPVFSPNEKVEFLCQDSGIRGCWFRCTVLELSRRQMKIQYDDVKDEDNSNNLEEWVPNYRVARADKLGTRHPGRTTVRPAYPSNDVIDTFDVGDPVDAWWSDGWWEGVISGTGDSEDGSYQIYIPGEDLFLSVEPKDLRVSRDWVGDRWVDVEPYPNICSIISSDNTDAKRAKLSTISEETNSDDSPTKVPSSHVLTTVEEGIHDLAGMTLTNVPLKDECTGNEQQLPLEVKEVSYDQQQIVETEEKETEQRSNHVKEYDRSEANVENGSLVRGYGDKETTVDDCRMEDVLVGQPPKTEELKCKAETNEQL